MAQFRIEIGETVFAVSSLFESTRDYCRSYLTEGEPACAITVCREDLAFEQDFLDEEAKEEGLKRRKFSDPFLERAAIQRSCAEFLLTRDTLLLHGSGLALDGQGYLFTAACGTGKSTHARFWRETLGAVAVNDDKPFVQVTEAGATMFGAPWSGKHGLDANLAVPLRGICILERGPENRIEPITPEEALPMLLHQSCPPRDPGAEPGFRELVRRLARQVPLWRMECTKDPSAAETARQAMAPEG